MPGLPDCWLQQEGMVLSQGMSKGNDVALNSRPILGAMASDGPESNLWAVQALAHVTLPTFNMPDMTRALKISSLTGIFDDDLLETEAGAFGVDINFSAALLQQLAEDAAAVRAGSNCRHAGQP